MKERTMCPHLAKDLAQRFTSYGQAGMEAEYKKGDSYIILRCPNTGILYHVNLEIVIKNALKKNEVYSA